MLSWDETLFPSHLTRGRVDFVHLRKSFPLVSLTNIRTFYRISNLRLTTQTKTFDVKELRPACKILRCDYVRVFSSFGSSSLGPPKEFGYQGLPRYGRNQILVRKLVVKLLIPRQFICLYLFICLLLIKYFRICRINYSIGVSLSR